MKRNILPLFILMPPMLFAQTGAMIDGSVMDSVTHAAVPGVDVIFWTQNGVRYNATTDTSGVFRIQDVQPGQYNSRHSKSGFLQTELPEFGARGLTIGIGGSYHLNAELARLATLRGRILDPEDKPAAGAKVEIWPYTQVEADAEGRFTLTGLHPGTYKLRAAPAGHNATGTKARTEIVTTYYPSAIDSVDADRVTIRGGADLAGFDIHLRASPVFRVRGVVLDEAGKPMAGASVQLLRPSQQALLSGREVVGGVSSLLNIQGLEPEGISISTDPEGRFEFPAVRPGKWQLQAQMDPRRGGSKELYFPVTQVVPAAVSDRDIENVDLRFEPDFALEVTADWGDRKAVPLTTPAFVRLFRTDANVPPFFGNATGEGSVRFGHLSPGRYRIVPANGPSGYYVAAELVDGRDVLGESVELRGGQSVRVVFRPNPGSVRGTVEKGEGSTVLLWAQGAGIPYLVPSVKAAANGSFEFNNVAPGTYSVVAFDRINAPDAPVENVLRAIANGAQAKVEELGVASVTVPVTRWPE